MITTLLVLIYLFLPASVSAQFNPTLTYDYVIENLVSDINLERDLTLSVTEKIDVYFYSQKHGIYRDIPVIYSNKGKTINSKISVKSVTDGINDVAYETERESRNIRIKIGDADKLVEGYKTYVISYEVKNVVLLYDEQPEIYWNVTGNGWDTVIKKAQVNVNSQYADAIEKKCFTGEVGETFGECNIDTSEVIHIETSKELRPGEGLTVAISYNNENGLIYPGFINKTVTFLTDNWGYLIAIIPFLRIFYLWYKKGRDESYLDEKYFYQPDNQKTKTVSVFQRKFLPLIYHPIDALSPAEAGVIYDERADINDIIAEVIELARLKVIRIQKIKSSGIFSKDDYLFIKEKESGLSKLKKSQLLIYEAIFDERIIDESKTYLAKLKSFTQKSDIEKLSNEDKVVMLSAMKNHFYKKLPAIRDELYQNLVDTKVFTDRPDKVKAKSVGIYIGVNVLLAIFIFNFITRTYNFGPVILLAALFAPGLIFALSMPKRAAWGYSLFKQTKGLKHYLQIGKWRHEINEKNLFFEEILPFAVSLGVVEKLAKDMQGLGIAPPNYFGGTTTGTFMSDFNSFRNSASSGFVSAPKSSGGSWSGGSGFSGGSSGGGFGGGGGGSW